MKMNNRVKQLGTTMTLAPCSRTCDQSVYVYYRKYFLLIIHIIRLSLLASLPLSMQ